MTVRGDIITFYLLLQATYSYKGGVGRPMAVANVGLTLAQWGHSVPSREKHRDSARPSGDAGGADAASRAWSDGVGSLT